MSTTSTATAPTRTAPSPGAAWRAGAVAGLLAAALNVAVLLVAGAVGADLLVRPVAGQPAETVGIPMVLLMTLAPVVVGTVLLVVLARRARAWDALAWIGLAAGLLTTPAPFFVDARLGTAVALAAMHVVTGVVWFVVVRRAARPTT